MPMLLLSLVARCHPFGVAFLAVEGRAECRSPTVRCCDPWPIHPRRVVPHVLLVPALELRDPVTLVIPVVPGDSFIHEPILIA